MPSKDLLPLLEYRLRPLQATQKPSLGSLLVSAQSLKCDQAIPQGMDDLSSWLYNR